MKKYVRKVTRVGKRSLSLVIPAEIVRELKIREKQKMVVHRRGKSIVIRDWIPRKVFSFAPSSAKAMAGKRAGPSAFCSLIFQSNLKEVII